MKVGIVQNRIIYGGRLAVIAGIVDVLNQRGIEPELITFRTEISPNGVYRQYGKQINFKIRRINGVFSKIPSEANILAFNLALHWIYNKYDYFINSNNTTFLMPSKIPILSYIHFPRIARVKSPYMNIHFPDGPLKQWCTLPGATAKLFRILYSFHQIESSNYIVTNSKFSRLSFQRYYPAYKKHIPVIYPPVKRTSDFISPFNERANMVCSIGRFCREKNQLAQIRLAKQIPQWRFKLIGFANKKNSYLKDCQRYVKEEGIKNVEFEINVPLRRKRELLQLAKFFIHPNINEPFGISTVESILNGCLPLVHDSGGQREIVPFADLRFKTLDEIPQKLKKFAKCDNLLIRLQKQLIRHCEQSFNFQVFKQRMDDQISDFESIYSQVTVSSRPR